MGISLYIHIPFCEHRCGYCSFVSTVGSESAKREYIELLSKEMELLSSVWPKEHGKTKVETLYFGGGTPSCLSLKQIDALFTACSSHMAWDAGSELTWEANPNTVTPEQAHLLRDWGVNRVSMGLQAANDEVLRTIDRIHKVSDYYDAYDHWVNAGIHNLSADLMTGLPGLTIADLDAALDRLLERPAIRHISTYALTLEADAPMARRGILLPTDDEERDQFEHLRRRLTAKGMERYEISNFAYPGWRSRHNSVYWTTKDYYALGLSASSKIGATRYKNPDRIREYRDALRSGRPPREIVEYLTESDRRFEAIMLPLRTADGLNVAWWEEQFGRDFEADYADAIKKLVAADLVIYRNRQLRLTDRGFDLSNLVYTEFMNEV